jgi:hypothetical protein
LEKKNSVSGIENRGYGRKDPSRLPHGTLYPQKLPTTSPTSGGRSVGIVRSPTQATEFSFNYVLGSRRGVLLKAKRLSSGFSPTRPGFITRQTLVKFSVEKLVP